MPTTYAHYRFGRDVYKQLPDQAQSIIRSHGGLYNIGLHGPDLLFYYKVYQKTPVSQTGFAMHDRPGDVVQISRDEVDDLGRRLPDVCIPPEQVRFCRTEDFLRELLLHRGDCSFCTKLIRRELFRKHRFPEGVLNEDFRLLVEMLQEIEGITILPKQCYHVVCRQESTTRRKTRDSFSRVFLDIVDNADRMQELVDRVYPELHVYAIRFNLFQRLDYLLHIPIPQMVRKNDFYQCVKRYLRRHVKDTVRNPYLTGKNKAYLLALTAAPRMVRKVHAFVRHPV